MKRLKIVVAIFLVALGMVSVALAQGGQNRQIGEPLVEIPILPDTPFDYTVDNLPQHILFIPDNIPANNPITDEGATLGRVLFYDKRLSANNTTACASCHLQADGFSDPLPLSEGFEGQLTRRNSMGLANARFFHADQFFWDTRADSLEHLALLPIQDPIEMGSDLDQVVAELTAEPFYPPLFTEAFGTPEITSDRMSLALAQFVRSMVSYESKYDVGVPINFANFTPLELAGLDLFRGRRANCSICHNSEVQIILEPRNNGLDLVYADNGLGEITGNSFDDGKFKPPSLRNIAQTAPYMHDGRFATLEEVIEHYSSGVKNHPNRDPFVPAGGFNFSAAEKAQLLAFFQTLTDERFLSAEKFSNPFVVAQPAGVTIEGGMVVGMGMPAFLTATVAISHTQDPLTYVWQVENEMPITHTGTISDVFPFVVDDFMGTKTVRVTASNQYGFVTATHTIEVIAPPSNLAVQGVDTGFVNTAYLLTATVDSTLVTLPLMYVWEIEGGGVVTESAGISNTISLSFSEVGVYDMRVSVGNNAGIVTRTHTITIQPYQTYLPTIRR